MPKVPTKFTGKDLVDPAGQWDDDDEHFERRKTGGKTPHDFEQLAAYLSAFPFKWRVKIVHDEPIPNLSIGGMPQIRVLGSLEGNGVKFGTFEVAFAGRRIDVELPPERQALFMAAIKLIPDK